MNETINEIVLEIARVQSTVLYFQKRLRDLETSLDVTVQLKMSGQIVTKDQVALPEENKKTVREMVMEAINAGVPKTTAALRKACLQKYPEDARRIKTNFSSLMAKLRVEGIEIKTSHPRKQLIVLNGDRQQQNGNHEEVTVRT